MGWSKLLCQERVNSSEESIFDFFDFFDSEFTYFLRLLYRSNLHIREPGSQFVTEMGAVLRAALRAESLEGML